MNDVISPMQVAGRVFLLQLSGRSVINLNFQTITYHSTNSAKGGSGAKGLIMSNNFPNPNINETAVNFKFVGIGNGSNEYSINVLRYDLNTTGTLTIKSTLSDSNFSRTLNGTGRNATIQFFANSFEVDYNSNGVGQKGFVLRYDVDSSSTYSSTATKSSTGYIIWICVTGGLLLIIAFIGIFGYLWYRRRKQVIAHLAQMNSSASHGNRVELAKMHSENGDTKKTNKYIGQPRLSHNETCTRDAWEVSNDQLRIFNHEKLGSGAFCVVFKGKLEGKAPISKIQPSMATQCFENCEVAVKKLPEFADESAKNDFLQEINFMKSIGYHSHLVSILGCITDPQLDPCLIIEYCCNGDLLKYVRNRRLNTVEEILCTYYVKFCS
uniref:Protein kinase domain-containing protein n=1 Tax=Plectus sambesii TaxID=2011161 RepID=A0A914WIH3_9BILA